MVVVAASRSPRAAPASGSGSCSAAWGSSCIRFSGGSGVSYLGQCLNPPCQVGGSIDVNGIAVELAADVEVQGVGDNRILRRVGTTAWYSVYAIPPEFIASGATPGSLWDSWHTRLQAEYEATQPAAGAPAPSQTAAPVTRAGIFSNGLLLVAGIGLVLAVLMRKGRFA